MNCTEQYVTEISQKTGFIANNVEKVIRLLDVLDFIFSKSSFKDALCLKGGTAINLVYTNLKRLSVDIDLDYHRHLGKDKTLIDRRLIVQELDRYMNTEGYSISNKSRESAILASRTYSYLGAFGNKDNIKVEINFIDRISLYPSIFTTLNYFGKNIDVCIPQKEELYGMKIAALIDRNKPRDLYDVDYLFNHFFDIDLDMLRKSIIFYLSLDDVFSIDKKLLERIKDITELAIKRELNPVLKKGEDFDSIKAIENAIVALTSILTLAAKESEYLKEFSKGTFDPTLLFDKTVSTRAKKHPMAKWRAFKIGNK